MMDSSGRIHMLEEMEAEARGLNEERIARLCHTGFTTKDPMPEQCNARKVLSALEKLADAPTPIAPSASALLPLTPFERGYVLGVLSEFRAWKASR